MVGGYIEGAFDDVWRALTAAEGDGVLGGGHGGFPSYVGEEKGRTGGRWGG